MTKNYNGAIHNNTWLFAEAVRNGGPLSSNTEATRAEARSKVRIKPAGPGVKNRRRAVEKYEGVRNSCPVCHLAMPSGGGECC
jgi:hypothetical protein